MYNCCRLAVGINQKNHRFGNRHVRCMSRIEAAKLLGVTSAASKKEIKNAYKEMAKLYHPDNKVTGEKKYR